MTRGVRSVVHYVRDPASDRNAIKERSYWSLQYSYGIRKTPTVLGRYANISILGFKIKSPTCNCLLVWGVAGSHDDRVEIFI